MPFNLLVSLLFYSMIERLRPLTCAEVLRRDHSFLQWASVCLLALAFTLAQPASYTAWFGGMHTTLGQAMLHNDAVEHGYHHHHGNLASGLEHGPKSAEVHRTSTLELGMVAPELGFNVTFAGLSPDFLKGTLVKKPAFISRVHDVQLLIVSALGLDRQHFPPVPHGPPRSMG